VGGPKRKKGKWGNKKKEDGVLKKRKRGLLTMSSCDHADAITHRSSANLKRDKLNQEKKDHWWDRGCGRNPRGKSKAQSKNGDKSHV